MHYKEALDNVHNHGLQYLLFAKRIHQRIFSRKFTTFEPRAISYTTQVLYDGFGDLMRLLLIYKGIVLRIDLLPVMVNALFYLLRSVDPLSIHFF